ncbi:MAG: nucleoside deaminase [Candidatus Woesearchaeota archaeon]
MKIAIAEAQKGIAKKHGGPFGAVIVKDRKIIAQAHNEVLITNDPTAHAEVNVIRKATKKLRRFDLSDCILYTSCEPCPMCLGAIAWARIPHIYYGCTRYDAEQIGFSDKEIYDLLQEKQTKPMVKKKPLMRKECNTVFAKWSAQENKKMY